MLNKRTSSLIDDGLNSHQMPALKCTDLTKEKLKVDSSYDGGVN